MYSTFIIIGIHFKVKYIFYLTYCWRIFVYVLPMCLCIIYQLPYIYLLKTFTCIVYKINQMHGSHLFSIFTALDQLCN